MRRKEFFPLLGEQRLSDDCSAYARKVYIAHEEMVEGGYVSCKEDLCTRLKMQDSIDFKPGSFVATLSPPTQLVLQYLIQHAADPERTQKLAEDIRSEMGMIYIDNDRDIKLFLKAFDALICCEKYIHRTEPNWQFAPLRDRHGSYNFSFSAITYPPATPAKRAFRQENGRIIKEGKSL